MLRALLPYWALVVPAVGLAELGGHFYFSSRAPSLEEWRAVSSSVRALQKHGELIVVAPDWAEPNARAAFGDSMMPLTDVARPDESTHPSAIEVSIIGDHAPELAGWKLRSEQRQGKFRLRVLENPKPEKPLYDFVDHVADATVVDVRGSSEIPCPWNPSGRKSAGGLHGDPAFPAARHDCGGEGHFVGVTVVEDQEWRGRRCLWAEPTTGTLSIRFSGVPVGRVIRGYATLPQWIERELHGQPVEMTVLVGGEPIGHYEHRDGDGWKRFEMAVPMPARAAGPTGVVEFRVSAARGGRERQFCFQADTR
jgi:hypothetical protein